MKRALAVCTLGTGLTGLVLLLLRLAPQISAAPAVVRHVCPTGCTYASIQAAVDDAAEGDLIKVAEGTYADVHHRDGLTQVVYISKSITVRGGYVTADGFADPPDPTAHASVLDAGRQGRTVYVAEEVTVTLEGLTLRNGDGSGLGGGTGTYADAGGGFYVDGWADVLVSDCVVAGNRSPMAGGGYVDRHATLTLRDSLISNNTAISGNAGGIFIYDAERALIRRNTIASNSAGFAAGGLYIASGLSDTLVSGNAIISNSAAHDAGGLFLASAAQVLDNLVAHNTAGFSGGGIKINGRGPLIAGNRIFDNRAESWGGGIYVSQEANVTANTIVSNSAREGGGGLHLYLNEDRLENNIVAANRVGEGRSGAGIYVWGGSPRLVHTTLAENVGGDGTGLYIGTIAEQMGSVAMTNTLVVSQPVGVWAKEGNTVTMVATLWGAGLWANGVDAVGVIISTTNLTGDPAFADPAGLDYHIGPTSTAVNAGIDAGVVSDVDGDARPADGLFDIGADEYWRRIHLPLVMRD